MPDFFLEVSFCEQQKEAEYVRHKFSAPRFLSLNERESCRRPITGIENLLDLLWWQECWKAGKSPAADRRYAIGQLGRNEALQMQVTQKGAHDASTRSCERLCEETTTVQRVNFEIGS